MNYEPTLTPQETNNEVLASILERVQAWLEESYEVATMTSVCPRTYRAKGFDGRAWRLRQKGWSYQEIADRLGVSNTKAQQGVKNYEQSNYFKYRITKRS